MTNTAARVSQVAQMSTFADPNEPTAQTLTGIAGSGPGGRCVAARSRWLYERRSRRRDAELSRRSTESPISHSIGGHSPTNSARRSAFPRSL